MSLRRLSWALALPLALAPVHESFGGPPPIDPKQMSGIARPDPQVPPGTVTVRLLGEGGFADPVRDATVTLEITAPDGTTETRTAQSEAEGRATFTGLEPFVGGRAVAKAELGGSPVVSGPIDLLAEAGSRVMLVQGASTPSRAAAPGSADPHARATPGPHGGSAVPQPGVAFPLEDGEPGRLLVGAFHLGEQRGLPGVELTLTVEPPEGEPIVRKSTTDALGKVEFIGLLPPEIPEGARLTVSGVLEPGGAEQRSQPFTMSKDATMALVLALGSMPQAAPPSRPAALPGPRILPSLATGTVQVRVVDPRGAPVAGQEIIVHKMTAAAQDQLFRAQTGQEGVAAVEKISFTEDARYQVEVVYQGAPFHSPLFLLDQRGGVAVDLRVWPTTSDPSVARSALQYSVRERENDLAEVIQVYELMVSGDRAFWDPDLRLETMPGAKGTTVMSSAEPWLDHEESAPFATLRAPLPPNEVVNLSIAYLLPHDGDVSLSWEAPFPLVASSVILPEDLELEADGAKPMETKQPLDEARAYELPARGAEVDFAIEGLRTRNPIFRYIALGALGTLFSVVMYNLLLRPRRTQRERLLERRAELIAALEKLSPTDADQRARLLEALDRVYRQLKALELLERSTTERAGA